MHVLTNEIQIIKPRNYHPPFFPSPNSHHTFSSPCTQFQSNITAQTPILTTQLPLISNANLSPTLAPPSILAFILQLQSSKTNSQFQTQQTSFSPNTSKAKLNWKSKTTKTKLKTNRIEFAAVRIRPHSRKAVVVEARKTWRIDGGGRGGGGGGSYAKGLGGRAGSDGPPRVEEEETVLRRRGECRWGRSGDGGDSVSRNGTNSESYLGSSHWTLWDHTNCRSDLKQLERFSYVFWLLGRATHALQPNPFAAKPFGSFC